MVSMKISENSTFRSKMRKVLPNPSIFLVLEQHFRKGREKSEKVLFLVIFMKIRTFLTFGPKSAHFGGNLNILTFWSKSEEIAKNMKIMDFTSQKPCKT